MITVRLTAEQIAEACIAWANEHYEMHGEGFNRCEVVPLSEGRVDVYGDVEANVTIEEETT